MLKDKLNKKDIHFFLIPFITLTLLFGTLTYTNSKNRIDELYKIVEESTLGISESYSEALINYSDSNAIATELLDEKILVASEAVLMLDEISDNYSIAELASRFRVDQINILNEDGVIIASNLDGLVGWTAYQGHPIYNYLKSGEMYLVEDIRRDTENGLYYKFGYVRRSDNTFVQIGVLAENVHKFTNKFEIQNLIENIVARESIEHALFIDSNHNIVAHNLGDKLQQIYDQYLTAENLSSRTSNIERCAINGKQVLHVSAPVYNGTSFMGTLALMWPVNIIDDEYNMIILNGIIEFSIIIAVLGAILYYAYRKNKSNIKYAYYDELTGLPNSIYLEEYLSEVLKNISYKKTAVLLLNCTNFKTLNMSYGYKYGDGILQKISNNIKTYLSPEDMIFRFNADRFVVILEDYSSIDFLRDKANGLLELLKHPSNEDITHDYVLAQAAILELHEGIKSPDVVLQDLSLALASLNAESNNNIVFYDSVIDNDVHRRDAVERKLRDVISGEDDSSFYLVFQPTWDLNNNNIYGFEALSRMSIEDFGQIPPPEFVDLAEKRLLIYDLGFHILELACDFSNLINKDGCYGCKVAVNISLIQLLREEFVSDVKSILKAKNTDGSTIEFEITESVIADNFELINNKLIEIRSLGINIALDDFGTGFSSFARLHSTNIDTVKIDRYFINRLDDVESEKLITADIISMAHKLGLSVVAEGVETEVQLQYLIKHGCNIIQGYYFSKPLCAEDAIAFLENKSSI